MERQAIREEDIDLDQSAPLTNPKRRMLRRQELLAAVGICIVSWISALLVLMTGVAGDAKYIVAAGLAIAGLLGALLFSFFLRLKRMRRKLTNRSLELEKTLEELREQKKRRAEAQQLAHLGTWEWRIGSSTIEWSDELYRIFGLTPGEVEVTYESYLSRVHSSDRGRVKQAMDDALVTRRPFVLEQRILRPDGSVRVLDSRGRVMLDPTGKAVRMIGFCQDVTERKKAEEALKESEMRYRTMLKAVPDLIFRLDANGVFRDYKAEKEEDLLAEEQIILGKRFDEALPEYVSQQLANAIHLAHTSGQIETFDYQIPVSDSQTVDYEARVVSIDDKGTLCIARNVTEERHAIERFQRLVEMAPDGIMIVDAGGRILLANPIMLTLLSVDSEDQILHHRVFSFIPEEEEANWTELLTRIVHRRLPSIQVESIMVRLTHRRFPAEIHARHCDWDGSSAVQFIVRDVTERKQAEQQLRSSHRYVRSIIDCSSDMIIAVDNRRLITEFNKAAERAFGYTAQEILGKSVDLLYADQTQGPLIHGKLTKDAGDVLDVLNRKKNGEVFTSRLSASVLHDADGRPVGMMGVSRDITAQKAIERMKDEFISTVSHELRTPLTSIVASLGLIIDGVTEDASERSKLLSIAYESSERLVRLVNDILDIEKIESGNMLFELKPTRLLSVLQEAVEGMSAYAESHNVKLSRTAGEIDPMVFVDRDRLIQVLTNLISNAIRFSPEGERVEVSVSEAEDRVVVSVSDHGPGIPEEFQPRIFQKFAQADSSDSRRKGGTGLGLAISKSIVERLGGDLTFECGPAGGTTFRFDLSEWR